MGGELGRGVRSVPGAAGWEGGKEGGRGDPPPHDWQRGVPPLPARLVLALGGARISIARPVLSALLSSCLLPLSLVLIFFFFFPK